MDIQRLRNLTTKIIHTNMDHIYEDIEKLVGEKGIMTHMIPNAMHALEPWLRQKVQHPRFWNGRYDARHTGELEVPVMTAEERGEFFIRFGALRSPLFGREEQKTGVQHES